MVIKIFALIFFSTIFALILAQPGLLNKDQDDMTKFSKCLPQNMSIFDFNVETLDGKFETLKKHQGNFLLVSVVATFCAYTKHYNDFPKILDKHKDMRILAFPCNQFGLQEPGENHEILNGIKYVRPGNNYQFHPNLNIYGKIEANGENHHPLFEYLKNACPQTVMEIGKRDMLFYDPIRVTDITWNFEKFLIDSDGFPRYRLSPRAWEEGHILDQMLSDIKAEGGGKKIGGDSDLFVS